jgi:hypothetical protein
MRYKLSPNALVSHHTVVAAISMLRENEPACEGATRECRRTLHQEERSVAATGKMICMYKCMIATEMGIKASNSESIDSQESLFHVGLHLLTRDAWPTNDPALHSHITACHQKSRKAINLWAKKKKKKSNSPLPSWMA